MRACIFTSLVMIASTCQAGSITYTLDSYTNVSGTITTDGTIGAINASDITAWSYVAGGSTFTGPTLAHPEVGTISYGSFAELLGTMMTATAQTIYLEPDSEFWLWQFIYVGGYDWPIAWLEWNNPAGQLVAGVEADPSGAFVIPEPSSIVMALIAGIAAATARFRSGSMHF